MEFTCKVDCSRLKARVEALRNGPKRLGISTAKALNATGRDVQTEERLQLKRWVHVRDPRTVTRFSPILAIADTRTKLSVTIEFFNRDGKGGWFMPWLEEGFQKQSRVRSGFNQNPAVVDMAERGISPVPITGSVVRPSIGDRLNRAMTPKGLALIRSRGWRDAASKKKHGVVTPRKRRVDRGGMSPFEGTGPWRGKYRTFETPHAIMQRDASGIHPLYVLHGGPLNVPSKLLFELTAKRVWAARFNEHLRAELQATLDYHAARGFR